MDKVPDINGLYVASGFSGHGFGIAPATSHILSNLLLNKPSELPIEAFSIRRFEKHKSSKKNEELTLHG
jgi:glycine/D-amino acid oxidase-like deaminating enzyme